MQQAEAGSSANDSPNKNVQEIMTIPKINILSNNITPNKQKDIQFNFSIEDQGINKNVNSIQKILLAEDMQEKTKVQEDEVSKQQVNIIDSNQTSKKASPTIQPISTNPQGLQGPGKPKLKISTQNLEKLSSQEKFDLALIALQQPANQRNPVEQRLIEETIDSFAYIQKMKKRKPTLAKQVARVVEYQKCKKGQAVFYAGQQPEKFYLILKGKVAVLLKKSDAQIAMDRKNGKVINMQHIIDRKFAQNNMMDMSIDKNDSVDLGSLLNTPKSPLRIHSPSHFAQQKNPNNNNLTNSPLLHNNSYLFANVNQNGLFGRKSSVQGLAPINSQINKHRNTSIFNSQFFNERNSESPLSTENSQAPPLDLIAQIQQQKDSQNSNSGELNTPTIKHNSSKVNGRQRNTISVSKNVTSLRQESRQIENISKNINMIPDELEELEKFYDNGVFRYEFAKDLEITQRVYMITHFIIRVGAAFGEMGLLLKVPRTATILAVEDTDFVVMSKQNYQQIIKSLENYKLEKKINFFHQALHFDFKIEEFGKLCIDFSQKKKFIKDQHIFKEGEKAKEVLVIKQGEVELYKTIIGPDGKKKKIQLSYIGPGEILGVEELFYSKDERYYNARCLHEVKAFYINKYLFIRLMHEIPDLKSIMEKRAKNKLKWQEFKIQEVIEQQKIEGILDKNTDLGLPQSDKQIQLLVNKDKTKKSKKANYGLDIEETVSDKKSSESPDQQTPINYQNFNDEYQLLKHSRSDLMAPHARKQHTKNEETNGSKPVVVNKNKIQEESLRGYDRIEDQIKMKEQVLEMIEKNTNSQSLLQAQYLVNDKKKMAEQEGIHKQVGHLICNENWFDLEKKKQLEQKIADAIKVRRQPPGNTKIHHLKLKQKVDTLPPVQNGAPPTIQTMPNSVTSLSSLPYDMQKKVIKFKKERDRSQFNGYINSLTDITQDELLSPVSTSSGQMSSLKALRKLGRPSLSLSGNDKSSRQIFFAQSESSMGEIQTPSPRQKLSRVGALHSSLNQLISLPYQGQKAYHPYQYTKTNNSQSSFQDIIEEPILESQLSQKNIDSAQKKITIFSYSNQKLPTKQPQMLQKQSTLKELEDEYEKETVVKGKSSLEAFDNLNEDSTNKSEKIQAENYYVKPTSSSKIRVNNSTKKIQQHTLNVQQPKISSIQYKSLNEIEQIIAEESVASSSHKGSLQHYFPNYQEQTNQTNNNHHLDKQNKQSMNLPQIKSSEALLSNIISPSSVKPKQYFQGGFKGNKMLKKVIDGKSNIFQNSSQRLDRQPPEFIIKSHNIQKQAVKQMSLSQQRLISNSSMSNNQSSTLSDKKNSNNFRSQSFQIKITNKN